jgi:hypothetical protein
MSDASKHASLTVAKIGAVLAALGLLYRIAEHVATVAAKFGTVTESVRGIGEKLDTHIRQTEDFRQSVEERLRKIEGKVGIAMNMEAE